MYQGKNTDKKAYFSRKNESNDMLFPVSISPLFRCSTCHSTTCYL